VAAIRLQVLDDEAAQVVERVCDAIVPGSARVRPAVYVDALLARMDEESRAATIEQFRSLDGVDLDAHSRSPAFLHVRALAIEAFYSDFVAPGAETTGAWAEIDFEPPLAFEKDWSYLWSEDGGPGAEEQEPAQPLKSEFEVVVVGSGAGGGVVAGELAWCGRDVLLLEVGPHLTSTDFTRWEAKADHDMYWPLRFAPLPDGDAVTFLAARCVGGTTTVNTSVALRAHEADVAKWHAATGLTNDDGEPFAAADLSEYYDRVEDYLGVRERSDWRQCVYRLDEGFRALGAELEPVRSYTDETCVLYGSCLQGCPTDGGKSTMNTYIADALSRRQLELRSNAAVERILIEDTADGRQATGVEYVDAAGRRHTVRAKVVVVAAGTLNTPQLLLRSGLRSEAIGRHVGLHPLRLVHGLFDEPQDAHLVYPITAHCMDHQLDEDGGFVIEAATVMDPIAFATTMCDESGPFWGQRLVDAVRQYRHWSGLLAMVSDENHASVSLDEDGNERFAVDFQPAEHERLDAALDFSREVLKAAGAKRVLWTGIISTHVQGSCRMGDDPAVSVVDRNCETHEVKRLYVGDGSLIPRTLSVNPSLTIMALATRLALHLETDASGYLSSPASEAAAAA
jgi:choline dehydrogenase-like flavoprotein